MKVVLLAGLKGSGKNTVANFLQERLEAKGHRVKQFALADELRRLMGILNPIVGRKYDTHSIYGEVAGTSEAYRYNEAIADLTYDKAKFEFPELRRLLQVGGTELFRGEVAETFWSDKLVLKLREAEKAGLDYAIITDVRFEDELAVLVRGVPEAEVVGVLISRNGCVSDGHASEKPDLVFSGFSGSVIDVRNDRCLTSLKQKVDSLCL